MDEIEELIPPVEPSKLVRSKREAGRLGGRSRSEAKRKAVRDNLAKARINRWPGRELAAANQALSRVNGGLANLHDNADIALDRTLELIAREEGVLNGPRATLGEEEALQLRVNSQDGEQGPGDES